MIRTFTSYHHGPDQEYKDRFVSWAEYAGLIQDMSVNTGDIDDTLSNEAIRVKIRDHYLKDSEVTVLLYGSETRYRKHIDWELKSSMINGIKNKRSGILVVKLPSSKSTYFRKCFEDEDRIVYPDHTAGWITIENKSEYENRYPNLPLRLIDNFVKPDIKISVVPWESIYQHEDRLRFLLEHTAASGKTNDYDLKRKMRMRNYNPIEGGIDHRTLRPWERAVA